MDTDIFNTKLRSFETKICFLENVGVTCFLMPNNLAIVITKHKFINELEQVSTLTDIHG